MPLGSSLPSLLPASTGTVKYVATTGNDTTGDGSQGNPWATLQKLLDTLTSGQVGEMAAGVYAAPTGVPARDGAHALSNRDGTSTDPIEVRAAAGATVRIQPASSGTFGEALYIVGASFWRFRGLIFELAKSGSNYQNVWVSDSTACTDIEFWNCTFRDAQEGSGILTEDNCPRIYLINCVSHDNLPVAAQNQAHGYYITGNDNMLINCVAYNQQGFGFQIRNNDADGPSGVIVANCVAYNCKPQDTTELAGFMAESESDNCQFWNNISYDNRNGFRGIRVAGQHPATANICRKNIANANDNTQFANNNATDWTFDFDGAGDHTGPGDNLTSDPLLTDPAGFDFTLQAGSPAIGYGNEAYCPTFDHNNTVRSQCDAGPFAYAEAPSGGVWFVA